MTTSRRDLLSGMLGFCVSRTRSRVRARMPKKMGPCDLGEPQPFAPDMVREQARALAAEAFGSFDGAVPEVLAGLNYDQHRDIRFRRDTALWHGLARGSRGAVLPPRLPLQDAGSCLRSRRRHGARGALYAVIVRLRGNGFKPDFPADLGFAGLRLHAPLNRPDHLDEVAVFLGASYFRAIGRGQRYGLSARGVAIDTGLPKEEEFPSFRAFWLERPTPNSGQVVAHALLDGPSLTGAYRLWIRPGDATTIDVDVTLFPREAIELLGIAPLTSMFTFGPHDRQGVDDFRPQVHELRRFADLVGIGRMVVAAAGQPPGEAQAGAVRQHRSEGLRPDAADARL